MFCRNVLAIVAVVSGSMFLAAPAQAGLAPQEFTVSVDRAAQDVTFNIDFPHAPDFFTITSHGQPADSFQFQIAPLNGDPLLGPTTVIRGDEIHFANALRIRNGSPPAMGDAQSGGWGTVRGTVPFTVNGTDLSFTASFKLLDIPPSGNFTYLGFTLQNGATAAQVESRAVPVPPAFWSGAIMLALLMAYGAWHRLTQLVRGY